MTIENKTPAVFAAWNAVIADMALDGVGKGGVNKMQGGYAFRKIDDVLNALSRSFAARGLAVRCVYDDLKTHEVATKKEGTMCLATVRGVYTLVSTLDGSTFDAGTFFGEAFDSGDKAVGKAHAYSYKLFACQIFAIPTAGDKDTENQSHERVGAGVPPQRRDTPPPQPNRDDLPRITKGPSAGKFMRDATDDELREYGKHVQTVLDNPAMIAHRDGAIRVLNQIEAEMVGRRE